MAVESSDYKFYHINDGDKIWWVEWPVETEGEFLFSFDRKTVYSFFPDYPDKLTPEQIKLFKRENPGLAALKE